MAGNKGKRLKALEVKSSPPRIWTIVRTFWKPSPTGPLYTGAQTRMPDGQWVACDNPAYGDGVTVNIHEPAEA